MGYLTTHEEGTPICSFQSNAVVPIEHLCAYFSPQQAGSGTPSPENVREIQGWNGIEVYNYTKTDVNTDIIPNEYKKVEYLESTGTQYIDTGYSPTLDTSAECEYLFTGSFSGDKMLFGAADNANPFYAEAYDGARWYCGCGGIGYRNVLSSVGTTSGNWYLLKMDKSQLNIDGHIVTPNRTYSGLTSHSIYIFAWHVTTAQYLHDKLRIRKLSFYESGVLSANYVPCRRKSDNKPGMYDTVTGNFYTNAGTGEFVCGPDIGETISI